MCQVALDRAAAVGERLDLPGPISAWRDAAGGSHVNTLVPLTLTARVGPPHLPAYGRLLLDVLNGNAALSIRGDEAEESWRVLAPVLSAWSKDLVPLEEYPAGSDGPPPRRA
jgi:glucose-6-phosphate 1-dehydrogenase